MKKWFIFVLLMSIIVFPLVSCSNRTTDIDEILDKYRDTTQFAFHDIGDNIIVCNDNSFSPHGDNVHDVSGLLYYDNNGILYESEFNEKSYLCYYSFADDSSEIKKTFDTDEVFYPTYDDKFCTRYLNKTYIYDMHSFELLEEVEGIDYRNITLGVSDFNNNGSGCSFVYNSKKYSYSLDDVIENNDLGDILIGKDVSWSQIYRYHDDFYISVNYKDSLLNRISLVFEIRDDFFYFIDYHHYTVDNVEFVKLSN